MRSVIHSHLFEDSLSGLIPDAGEADRFIEAAVWLLSKNPELGTRVIDGSQVWHFPLPPINGRFPSLYYTFDDSAIHLLQIEIAAENP